MCVDPVEEAPDSCSLVDRWVVTIKVKHLLRVVRFAKEAGVDVTIRITRQ